MGWLSGWDKRIKLTIDSSKVDTANLTNFPVLIHLSSTSGITSADVSCVFDELTSDANRKKIAVTTSDGETQCYVEIERWDDASEKAWLWVKVPSVAYNSDTELYLYYDKDHADNTTYIGDTGSTPAQNVWDSNFILVHHMSQDPSGGSGCMKDSTSNEFNGTPGSALTSGRLVDALIGKGIQFEDGTQTDTNDYIDVSDLAALDNLSNITVEVSYKQEYPANSSPAYEQTLVSKRYDGSNHSFRVYISASSNKIFFALATDDTDTDSPAGTNDAIVVDTNYCFAGRWKSSYDKIECFLDGIKQSSEIDRIGDTVRNNTAKFVIGGEDYAGTMMRPADGIIDEVRISNAGRADEWIKATTYSNKDNLVTFGSEEAFLTNFFDGKIRIKNVATNLLDGKAFIDTFDIDLLDGKARIKNIDTNLLDGKVIVKSAATNLLDGKTGIKHLTTNLLDGKTYITYTGQINGYCPTPTCEMSAVFRYARIDASPPVPTASFRIGRIIEGDCPVPEFTCIAYSGRNPSIIANAPCPTCSMRIGLSFSGDVPVPTCDIVADTHHLATIYGWAPTPLFTCIGDTENITVISGTVPTPTGLFEATVGNVASILGRVPCPYCTMVALTGQVVTLSGRVPVPGSLVRFYASLANDTIILTGTVPTPTMTSSVDCFTSSILRHVRGKIR